MVNRWSRRNSEKKNIAKTIHPPPIGKSGWVVDKTCTCISRCFKLFFQTKIRSFGETSTCKGIFWPEHIKIYHLTHNPSLARLTAIPCRTAAPSFSQMTRRCPSFAWNAGCVVFFAKALVVGFGRYLGDAFAAVIHLKMLWDFGEMSILCSCFHCREMLRNLECWSLQASISGCYFPVWAI